MMFRDAMEQCVLAANKTSLIIVDMQKDFIYTEGRLYVTDSEKIVAPLKAFLNRCRANGLTVVFTQDWHPEDAPEFRIWPKHCVAGTQGAEIIDELKPNPDEFIVKKETYDAFFNTELEDILNRVGVENVILTGVVANICVLHTAGSAALRGFKVILPVDCIAALNDFDLKLTIRQVSFLYRGIITSSELISFDSSKSLSQFDLP
ncbi:cysteine hydrolase [Candidatus Bathyarchaeota archaeon]|nr:cysteine hydrolase [Candidatus Bathyarchaeota archaeon]MBS7613103.1 cysteine hydrolase [Candidatus Bathyarchaeota archaeon]MBS7617195.1 cysteine hydrolase [Candidatus Bathyarchaeota archaeon]